MSSGQATEPPTARGCAFVTGSSRGIGAAIARALADDGWAVGVNYRADRDGAERVAREIRTFGGRSLVIQADVSDAHAVERAFSTLQDAYGPVLVLVNNAGVGVLSLVADSELDEWRRVIDTNLTAAYLTMRRALLGMLRARYGRVVNVISAAAHRAIPGQASYAASKAGVEGLTRTAAIEVARRGVTVNAVAPGWIDTDLAREAPAMSADMIPARRMGKPEEVAACVCFLASERASYVTGSTLFVDGGASAALTLA
jgi:3-oxoacyl-[acyl-carrier protein] reductase